jgi:uncharacterized membrane protein YgcG
VKAGKAYISSLGTTGLLIVSSLLLLLVVGALFAYDRWPDEQRSRADVVAVGAERAVRARTVTAHQRARVRLRAERRRAAMVRRRRARARVRAASEGSSVAIPGGQQPIISDLPAPDSDGSAGQSGGGSAGAGGGTQGGVRGGTGGGETTRQLGDAVSNVSPEAGTAIGDVGGALDQAVGATPPSPNP